MQHKRCYWMAVSLLLSIFTFFPVRCEMLKYSQIRTLKWRLVLRYQKSVWSESTKTGDFRTHCSMGVLAYVSISKRFIWK